jgi:hypothetical protein
MSAKMVDPMWDGSHLLKYIQFLFWKMIYFSRLFTRKLIHIFPNKEEDFNRLPIKWKDHGRHRNFDSILMLPLCFLCRQPLSKLQTLSIFFSKREKKEEEEGGGGEGINSVRQM